jgi:hypothetical protein
MLKVAPTYWRCGRLGNKTIFIQIKGRVKKYRKGNEMSMKFNKQIVRKYSNWARK